MKKKKTLRIVVAALVALALLIVVVVAIAKGNAGTDPHAGHDHSTGQVQSGSTGHTHAEAAHNKSAKNSYEVKRQGDGSYIYRVVSRAGHSYTTQQSYSQQPTVTEISNDVIAVSGMLSEKNNLSRWAVYYNVADEGQESRTFNYVLAAGDSKVAYLTGNKGQFLVTVCDPFNEAESKNTRLPGLTVTQTGNPEISYKVVGKNVLQVTYTVDGAERTVSVSLK